MSLNGLDTAAVVEAYQCALADAGGWFLLYYIARDEVALLERGTGGVPEVRNAIDNYEETSPLYGFLQYRRRKVILRYMPEGLSRLILARSNVQFSSVLEKFTPNDTVLVLTQASDLNESALSSACLLHTASGSITSSSSSLRRRRLMEITEDAEESGTKEEKQPPQEPQEPPSEVRQRSGSLKSEATVVPPVASSPEIEQSSPDLHPPPSRASSRPPPSRGTPSETNSESMSPTPQSPASSSGRSKYRNILDEFPRPSDEARLSTQSTRPSLRELERASTYSSTPKVKLGPRPSLDQSGRPRTSGSSKNAEQRPVASLPSNMRSSSVRKQNVVEPPRPRSQGSSFATRPNSRAPPIPPLLVPPPSIPISRPQLSPGAKSLGALSTSSGLTPEKERLMKALQQRRKAMAKRAEDTKRKSSIAEVDEPKAQAETTNLEENKENLNPTSAGPEKFEPGPELDQIAREQSSDLPLRTFESPAPELRHEIPMKNEESPILIPSETSEPEPMADIAVSDSEDRPSSHTSGPGGDTTFSTELGDLSEVIKSETPQTVPEDETRAELGDSAISVQTETKEELVSPSVIVGAPLVPVSTEVPEVPEQLPEPKDSPSPPPETPASVSEQLEISVVEPTPEETPESADISAKSPTGTPPSPEVEATTVAPVTVSIDPVPLNEHALDDPSTQKTKQIPLDQRRKIHLEPIQVPTLEYSDEDCLLSDDSFMEELRSATVQEARPVAVSSPNGGQHWRSPSRAVSSPHGFPSPSASQTLTVGGRSTSTSYLDNRPVTPVLMAKKVNVSSGISSRIKALEKFSSREGTPNPTLNGPGPSASSSFENLRKRASVSYSGDITLPDFSRAPSVNLHDSRPTTSMSRRQNSISVTAPIVRDSNDSPAPSGSDRFESDVLNLQPTPLSVEQEHSAPQSLTPPPPVEPASHMEDRSMSMSSTGSNRQTPISRPASRLSLSSRAKTDENLQSSSPTTEDKKLSRASRLMRRMSSITSTSRRSIIGALSSPVREEDLASITAGESAISPASSHHNLSKPIEIGEVNVQFPDTLLWKRRHMRIDENGYVVLTPGTTDATARNMIKRYHLTEFQRPCLPDEDMQELPNSILLNFLDGSTLQCACESRQGQTSALQSLIDAHTANQS
ncbi:hypothetical protein N7520_011209 [Penicillium odoratum]|uniref:uncharacterized protein n=1 Tax=Penicillium odoratum TaxID=1167516 RepID=UPI002546701C|nr:uncharacterized protein N7520_011209 [Penicillium odoratum]KAJ5746027.1 hypothetical protein N7520_011209 [Penicillium odoratum]